MDYTEQQLKDFDAYEFVRQTSDFNMYDPHARYATGLDSKRYAFVMSHYSELRAARTKAA